MATNNHTLKQLPGRQTFAEIIDENLLYADKWISPLKRVPVWYPFNIKKKS
jgi:hypothetical protein